MNNLDAGLKGRTSDLANNTTLAGGTHSRKDTEPSHAPLGKPEGWALTNHLTGTKTKRCLGLHRGRGNPAFTDTRGEHRPDSGPTETHLSLWVNTKCKRSQQHALADKRASHFLGGPRPSQGRDCPTLLWGSLTSSTLCTSGYHKTRA